MSWNVRAALVLSLWIVGTAALGLVGQLLCRQFNEQIVSAAVWMAHTFLSIALVIVLGIAFWPQKVS